MPDGTFTLQIKGLDQLQASFQKAGPQFKTLLTQAMDKSTTLIQNRGRNYITDYGISNTGNLRRSIQKRASTPTRGVVGVGEKYGYVVEKGRKPGSMPPVAPIERWAATKLGKPGLGFIIARSIARKGTKAQPFMESAFTQSAKEVLGYFSEATRILLTQVK